MNLTTTQIEMQELKAENEHLKTDCSDDLRTQEQSANYTQGTEPQITTPQVLVPQPTTKEAICVETLGLNDLFYSL